MLILTQSGQDGLVFFEVLNFYNERISQKIIDVLEIPQDLRMFC